MFACGKGRVAGRKEKRPRKKGKGGYTQKEKGKETYRSPASTYLSVFTEYTFQVLVLTATFGRSKSEFNFVYS